MPTIADFSLPILLATLQGMLALRLLRPFGRVFHRRRIPVAAGALPVTVSVLVPVLNEEARVGPTLAAILAEARDCPEIIEILVVDGGSTDGTPGVVAAYAAGDDRLRFVDVAPVPVDAVGKAWGLLQGTARARGDWVLTLDADTVIAPGLTRAVVTFARNEGLGALSIATRQACHGWLQSMLHPAFLTTLVYRFGPPGFATRDWRRVMANGQCFLASKSALDASGAIGASLSSLSEDITMARTMAKTGHAVGFFETDVAVDVRMYDSARDVWANWPRSLVMRDQFADWRWAVDFAQLVLVQALPLPLLAGGLLFDLPLWFVAVQAVLVSFRLGVLAGVRGGYGAVAPSFWVSPLMDMPVALRLLHARFQNRLLWRGRVYERGRDGRIRAPPD